MSSHINSCFAYDTGDPGAQRDHAPAARLPRQRRPHHPTLLAALPLHQHVAVQQAGEGPAQRPVQQVLGRQAHATPPQDPAVG